MNLMDRCFLPSLAHHAECYCCLGVPDVLREDIYGLTWLILQSACRGWGVKKTGGGNFSKPRIQGSKFLSIPKEIAIRETFLYTFEIRYISLKIFPSLLFSALAYSAEV